MAKNWSKNWVLAEGMHYVKVYRGVAIIFFMSNLVAMAILGRSGGALLKFETLSYYYQIRQI